MSRFLMIDIGAGTMDILYYDSRLDVYYKAVTKSPVINVAEKIARTQGDLLITGAEMGGGALAGILRERAESDEIIMTNRSASTINHNQEKVLSLGIKVIDEGQVANLKLKGGYSVIEMGDLEMDRLKDIVQGMGVPFSFDVVGICAQDHGVPPEGISHLDFRHNIFKSKLDLNPSPYSMLYRDDEVPLTMNRLKSIAESAGKFSADEVYVMDSGMAAITGACLDPLAMEKDRLLVLDIATSHTVGAVLEGKEILGFFEYHTKDITVDRLETLLIELADGKLDHNRILEEGGHGAYIRKGLGFQRIELIVATGPKRSLIKDSKLSILLGSPLGDNMMTGTAGLLEVICKKKGLEHFSYS